MTDEQRRKVIAAFREEYDTAPMDRTRPYEGANACLAALLENGIALQVATNKPAMPTARLLERWFPGVFSDCVTIDTIQGSQLSKAEMLTELVRRRQLSAATSVMVGDSPSDLRAGRALGWRTVAALHGYSNPADLKAESPDWTIRALAELPTVLASA
jgi:phosphoglycolate phosphatase